MDTYQIEGYPILSYERVMQAPELQDTSEGMRLYTKQQDNYEIALLVFMLLMPGKFPYNKGNNKSISESVKNMSFAFRYGKRNEEHGAKEYFGLWRFAWSHLGYELKQAFYYTFQNGQAFSTPERRRDARFWQKKVEELEKAVLETIKLHIELLINAKELLKQMEKYNTKKLAKSNIENIEQSKEREIEKISKLKKCLYEDWKNEYITKEEYFEYKHKYELDIERIKKIIINLKEQKAEQEKIAEKKSKWIENFKRQKNIYELDRDILIELIEYIEVYENKKIKIHFKFTNELDKILDYIDKDNTQIYRVM